MYGARSSLYVMVTAPALGAAGPILMAVRKPARPRPLAVGRGTCRQVGGSTDTGTDN
jgi:hypothetical protein